MVSGTTMISDTLGLLKSDLLSNITDPISGTRPTNNRFIMTSYPSRQATYPVITLRTVNISAPRLGMQTTTMDIGLNIEARIWARSQKEKDDLFVSVFNRLKGIQFTASGTVLNNLHDFRLLSCVDVDEDGEAQPKSKVMEIYYRFVS